MDLDFNKPFFIREYLGSEILDENFQKIPNTVSLSKDRKFFIPSLFGGYHEMIFDGIDFAKTENGAMGASISKSTDDRDCWICNGMFNLEALNKINFD